MRQCSLPEHQICSAFCTRDFHGQVHEIVPINILEAYSPTVAQYGLCYSLVSILLLTTMAGVFSPVQVI